MGVSKRFIVTKKQMEGAITYLEYERIHGVSFKPKKSEFDDMINVSKVVVINPSLIEKLVDEDSAIVTLFYGEDVTEEAANNLRDELEEKFEDLDIELYYGGQPLYYYLISVE